MIGAIPTVLSSKASSPEILIRHSLRQTSGYLIFCKVVIGCRTFLGKRSCSASGVSSPSPGSHIAVLRPVCGATECPGLLQSVYLLIKTNCWGMGNGIPVIRAVSCPGENPGLLMERRFVAGPIYITGIHGCMAHSP